MAKNETKRTLETTNDTDDFQRAFATAAKSADGKPDAKEGERETKTAKKAGEDESNTKKSKEESSAKDKDEEKSDEEKTPEQDDYKTLYEREKQRFKSLEGRYRKERDSWQEERNQFLTRLNAAEAAPEGVVGPDAEKGAPPRVDPSMAQSLQSMIRHEARALLEPVMQRMEQERHVQSIATAHPDWEEVARDAQLESWIDEHPDYLAASMRDVLSSGAADQVIDLITRFKQARTRGSSQAARPRSDDAARPSREQTMRAQQAAAVPSHSAGPPPSKPDPNDYMTAWQEAVGR